MVGCEEPGRRRIVDHDYARSSAGLQCAKSWSSQSSVCTHVRSRLEFLFPADSELNSQWRAAKVVQRGIPSGWKALACRTPRQRSTRTACKLFLTRMLYYLAEGRQYPPDRGASQDFGLIFSLVRDKSGKRRQGVGVVRCGANGEQTAPEAKTFKPSGFSISEASPLSVCCRRENA